MTNDDIPRPYDGATCSRCGGRYSICVHMNTHAYNIDPAHAERIKARYALGQTFAPPADWDTATFTDPGFVPNKVLKVINGNLIPSEEVGE